MALYVPTGSVVIRSSAVLSAAGSRQNQADGGGVGVVHHPDGTISHPVAWVMGDTVKLLNSAIDMFVYLKIILSSRNHMTLL